MENRKIFYDTHPAIISLEVFDKVQEIRQQRQQNGDGQEQYVLRSGVLQ